MNSQCTKQTNKQTNNKQTKTSSCNSPPPPATTLILFLSKLFVYNQLPCFLLQNKLMDDSQRALTAIHKDHTAFHHWNPELRFFKIYILRHSDSKLQTTHPQNTHRPLTDCLLCLGWIPVVILIDLLLHIVLKSVLISPLRKVLVFISYKEIFWGRSYLRGNSVLCLESCGGHVLCKFLKIGLQPIVILLSIISECNTHLLFSKQLRLLPVALLDKGSLDKIRLHHYIYCIL